MSKTDNLANYSTVVLLNKRMPPLHPETRPAIDRVLDAHGIPHTATTVKWVPHTDWEQIHYEVTQAIYAALKAHKSK